MNRLAYLMYHEIEVPGRARVGEEPGYVRYVVEEATFRAQIERIRADGLRGISVGDAMADPDARAARVVITFDDGAETDLVVAAPILREAGFGATFYVTVDHLDRRGFLSEAQLRELADQGFEIGSHAMTHRYLQDLPTPEIREELVGSKKRLEDHTGKPVRHFSCPGGRWDRRVAEEARAAGYETLVTSVVGLNGAESDRFHLRRIAVMRGMGAPTVARFARGEGLARRRATTAVLDLSKKVLGNARYERLRAIALRRR
jgi:peptidoglycan/xylan/chitin deacetylase (PgdA/CDA1 family)